MSNILISVVHPTARVKPSAGFPRGWVDAMLNFYERCAEPSRVEYILVVHESRWDEFWGTGTNAVDISWGSTNVIKNPYRDCVVDQLNVGCAAADKSSKVLIATMDDLRAPKDWDRLIVESFPDLDTPHVVQYSSCSPRDGDLIVAGAITRARYESVGYCLHPDYTSMYADDDFTTVARRDGVMLEAKNIQFEHLHPGFGKGQWDEIYENQNSEANLKHGIETFKRRIKEGFPPYDMVKR
jgi:hypothetical protein